MANVSRNTAGNEGFRAKSRRRSSTYPFYIGTGSKIQVEADTPEPQTIWNMLLKCAETNASAVALSIWTPKCNKESNVVSANSTSNTDISRTKRYQSKSRKRQSVEENTASSWTWVDYVQQAKQLALSFLHLNVSIADGVLFHTQASSVQLFFLNMAAIGAGATLCHLPPQLRNEEFQKILEDSGGSFYKLLITDQLPPLSMDLTGIKAVVYLSAASNETSNSTSSTTNTLLPIYSFEEFSHLGQSQTAADMDLLHANIRPCDPCLISYQYDPNGELHGAVLSHDNIGFTATQLARGLGTLSPIDRMIAYLPMHFVASQILEIYMPLAFGGPMVYLIESANENQEFITTILKHIKPTIFFATPYTWTQISIQLFKVKSQSNTHSILYRWAKLRAISNARKLQGSSVQ